MTKIQTQIVTILRARKKIMSLLEIEGQFDRHYSRHGVKLALTALTNQGIIKKPCPGHYVWEEK